jgi:hypothetical protein
MPTMVLTLGSAAPGVVEGVMDGLLVVPRHAPA